MTKEEKELLKSLTNHSGFKLMEQYLKDFEYNLLKQFKTLDFTNADDVKKMEKAKTYLQGGEDFVRQIKNQTQVISKKYFK